MKVLISSMPLGSPNRYIRRSRLTSRKKFSRRRVTRHPPSSRAAVLWAQAACCGLATSSSSPRAINPQPIAGVGDLCPNSTRNARNCSRGPEPDLGCLRGASDPVVDRQSIALLALALPDLQVSRCPLITDRNQLLIIARSSLSRVPPHWRALALRSQHVQRRTPRSDP